MQTSILDIASDYDVILLDAYGVFWGGGSVGMYPGALQTFEHLKSQGKIVGIISNATILSQTQQEKYEELGGLIAHKHYDFLITSGQLTHELFITRKLPFNTPRKTFWVFHGYHPKHGPIHKQLFEGTLYQETEDVNQADFIYAGVPSINGKNQTDPSLFEPEVQALAKIGLPLFCANPDKFANAEAAQPVVRQGIIADFYEKHGGKVHYVGKPYQSIFEAALTTVAQKYDITDKKKIMMVGDNIETDIRGGKLIGLDTALITKTGIFAPRIERVGKATFLEHLPQSDQPTHTIDYFATPPQSDTISSSTEY